MFNFGGNSQDNMLSRINVMNNMPQHVCNIKNQCTAHLSETYIVAYFCVYFRTRTYLENVLQQFTNNSTPSYNSCRVSFELFKAETARQVRKTDCM